MSKTLPDFVLDYDHAMTTASQRAIAAANGSPPMNTGSGSMHYGSIPSNTIMSPNGNIAYTIGYIVHDEDEDEDENMLSTSAILPEGQMIGRCANTNKTMTLVLKPDSGMSVPDCMKISMLLMAYDTAGPEEFSPYEYVKANNLERHFQIRDAEEM